MQLPVITGTEKQVAWAAECRDRVLKLCATVRQQATEALPINRPTPTPVAIRPGQHALSLSGPQGSKGTDLSRRGKAGRETHAQRASAR